MAEHLTETTPSLEERKLALEETKVEIEFEKLRVERLKGWTTGGSIVMSLLIAALTIAFGMWSQHRQVMTQIDLQNRQSKAQLDLQEMSARSQFEIKAAEVVMDTNIPGVTHNKAKALLALFPGRLPENFAKSFDPSKYTEKPLSNTTGHRPSFANLFGPQTSYLKIPWPTSPRPSTWPTLMPKTIPSSDTLVSVLDSASTPSPTPSPKPSPTSSARETP